MKVVLCTPFKGVGHNNPGGIAIWARNIKAFYESHTSNVDLEICPIDRKHDAENVFSFKRIWYGVKEYLDNYRKVCKYVKGQNFDVMHICTSASLSLLKDLLFLKVAKSNGMKSVVHFHFGRIPQIFEAKNWEYRLLNNVLKKANVVAVMDMLSYDTLRKAGFKNVVYLPNPLSTTVCEAIEKASEEVEGRKEGEVLFVGHVIPSKGVYELVEACAKVEKVQRLILLGCIEEQKVQDDLMALADSIRGSHAWINFTGPVPHDQVISEMLSCNLFVLPTYTEGFPNVILESMACACPIITTPVGAIPAMLDSKSGHPCGSLVKVRDAQELQARIESYLKAPAEAITMGKYAKNRVYTVYSMDAVWKLLLEVWTKAYKS